MAAAYNELLLSVYALISATHKRQLAYLLALKNCNNQFGTWANTCTVTRDVVVADISINYSFFCLANYLFLQCCAYNAMMQPLTEVGINMYIKKIQLKLRLGPMTDIIRRIIIFINHGTQPVLLAFMNC